MTTTMTNGEADREAPSFRVEGVVGLGRAALIVAMFGAGWLGWGLGIARVFNGLVGPAFGFTAFLLWAWSIFTIQKGRRLRNQYPRISDSARGVVRRSFFLVVLIEVVVLVFVFVLANRLHRPDLGADWAAMVVGLHFLPLAKIFGWRALGVFGVLITLWCVFCWAMFRWDALLISVAVGTGILLWATAVSALFRAREIARSLQ